MRGFYESRRADVDEAHDRYSANDMEMAKIAWSAPLGNDEIAAAKREGCAGCVWSDGTSQEMACNRTAPAVDVGPRNWCSEWRQKPATDTSEGNP